MRPNLRSSYVKHLIELSTYAKSSRTSKVNSILYASPLHTPLNGILLHTPSCDHARFDFDEYGSMGGSPSTGLKADKREAWKRRKRPTTRDFGWIPVYSPVSTYWVGCGVGCNPVEPTGSVPSPVCLLATDRLEPVCTYGLDALEYSPFHPLRL